MWLIDVTQTSIFISSWSKTNKEYTHSLQLNNWSLQSDADNYNAQDSPFYLEGLSIFWECSQSILSTSDKKKKIYLVFKGFFEKK